MRTTRSHAISGADSRARGRRWRAALGTVAAVGLLGVGLAPSAGAIEEADLPVPVPACDVELPEGILLALCVEIVLTGGQAQFGGVSSDVSGPIVIRQVVGVDSTFTPIMIEEDGEGGGSGGLAFPAINVPGGIFAGIPLLEDLSLGPITEVNALIKPLDELSMTDPDVAVFLGGNGTLTTASLPLQVQVDNLLLGDTCNIGSAADPIVFNLPIEVGEYDQVEDSEGLSIGQIAPVSVTDDAFSVPAAAGCGILGTGNLIEGLGLAPLNLFNGLVNDSVGLPSPSGSNLLHFDGFIIMTAAGL